MCILRDLPPSRRTLGRYVYAEGAPQFYMFPCSHGNISFLQIGKEARKSKDSCLCKGRFPYDDDEEENYIVW
jgi:hypothetical protein